MSQLFASGGQKYWRFSFNISPSNEHPELISFRMDWLGLFAVQGTLKSLLQHHSSKASSVLSFLYSPTLTSIHDFWKNIALTTWTFVGKGMSLLINMEKVTTLFFWAPKSLQVATAAMKLKDAYSLEGKL